jgi:hypothetical protein
MTCIANVDAPGSGWALKLYVAQSPVGDRFRVEVSDPDRVRLTYSLLTSLTDAFDAVKTFLEVERLPHVGVALVEAARAEIRMSGVGS